MRLCVCVVGQAKGAISDTASVSLLDSDMSVCVGRELLILSLVGEC